MTSRCVLIIDDDPSLSRVIELSLAPWGDVVFRYALNGWQGMQVAAANPPDLILLDFQMPVMDGLETLRHLRATQCTAHTPIVAITGAQRALPRCAEMIDNCDGYVPKPFALNALRRAVRPFLDSAD